MALVFDFGYTMLAVMKALLSLSFQYNFIIEQFNHETLSITKTAMLCLAKPGNIQSR
jgi:hypothetical protein